MVAEYWNLCLEELVTYSVDEIPYQIAWLDDVDLFFACFNKINLQLNHPVNAFLLPKALSMAGGSFVKAVEELDDTRNVAHFCKLDGGRLVIYTNELGNILNFIQISDTKEEWLMKHPSEREPEHEPWA